MQLKIKLPSYLEKVFADLKNIFKDKELFLVGGAVRDILLNNYKLQVSGYELQVTDVDFCTNAKPEEIKKLLQKYTKNVFEIGKKFGTISCIKDNLTIQITTYRTEIYDGLTRKPEVTFTSSLREDLSRRDFTINALVYDGKNLIDFFNGKKDLKEKIIKFVGNPLERIKEDPLRMLRAVRFSCELNFKIEKESLIAIKEMSAELKRISFERIAQEMDKILLSNNPDKGIQNIYDLGLHKLFLPLELMQVEQPKQFHHKDVFQHTLLVLKNSPKDLAVRWAALLHDIGKGPSRIVTKNGVHFYGHEKISKKFARKILRTLHYKKSFIDEVSNLVDWHMDLHGYGREGEVWKDNTIRRLLNKLKDLYPKFIGLVKADITSARPQKVKAGIMRVEDFEARAKKILEEEKIEKIKPLVDGNEIMQMLNIAPSRIVGEIKNYIFQKQLDLGANYTKEDALIDVRKKFKELQ